ncbi:MAG: translation initiation factor IF-2 [Nanoarchaeota archaeon]|nr:translation initiation factor IF-2 [Patescibacteria group bacterium]MBU4124628.1 translation initiation factor IF-2 [Nanoarchaeota archaeon]
MEENKKNLITRSPVVVILGHVDHGKSSILEAIKDLKITSKESGGITQHIAAYEVLHPSASSGQVSKITFVDTPGHEAFSAMRSRGSKVADIAILVIAAEEGIKPQTKEAIAHIKEAGIPMIVALNKTDKPQSDPEKVKRDLMSEDVLVESMGGKIPSINVSAQTKKGITELLEMIVLIAEMENFQVDISGPAEGIVVESHIDSNRGTTATLIVQSGSLKIGDIFGTFSSIGKIKGMKDFQGNNITEATPSMPVTIIGFDKVPGVGEAFKVFLTTEEAKEQTRKSENLFERIKVEDEDSVLKVIIKADVQGSLEAIKEVLKIIPQGKAVIQVLKAEVGDISDSDIQLAKNSGAMTIGFRVKANPIAQKLALREKIRIISFDVIYHLAEAVKIALEKKVAHETVRKDLGKVKILAIFKTDKNSQIIGGKVLSGEMIRGASVDVYRNEEKIGAGKIAKLQKEKKEVGEVGKGYECGMLYKGDIEVAEDDILEVFTEERYKPGLE